MILRPLTNDDRDEAIQAHQELALDDFGFLLASYTDGEPWDGFVDRVEASRLGVGLQPGYVASTFLVADVGGQIVGRSSIRHELNDYLLERGGHIGYGVRPAFRRLGYATEILRQSLKIAHDLGIEKALVTCDDVNIGSSRTIEKCGGVLENIIELENGEMLRRYWIST